jgi:hypothetical protein
MELRYGFPIMTCYSPSIMVSSLANALSQRPAEELRKMLDTARTAVQRAQFEVEVIEEAIASAPKSPIAVPSSSKSLTPQEIREMVLRIIRELGPVTPTPIRAKINDESINVYNALNQLLKSGELTRENGVYSLPTSSANGQHPGGLEAGTQLSGPPPL